MELRHLRYFCAVARELHFGRAAESLGIAQPPLSQQIKDLERELGAQLLSRENKRKIELTAAGEAFLVEAEKTLRQAEAAARAARRAARGESGRLEIGFVSSAITSKRLTAAMKEMRRTRPGVSLTLHERTTAELLELLRAGMLDVAFLRPPGAMRDDPVLKMKTILMDKLFVALPKGHRLAGKREIDVAELKGEPFIMVPRGGFYEDFEKLCRAAGFAPNVEQESRSLHTIISLVAAGIGISVAPESMTRFSRDSVVYKSFAGKAPCSPLAAMWRADDSSPALKAFLDTLWRTVIENPARPAKRKAEGSAKAGSPSRTGRRRA